MASAAIDTKEPAVAPLSVEVPAVEAPARSPGCLVLVPVPAASPETRALQAHAWETDSEMQTVVARRRIELVQALVPLLFRNC